jgi:hypothetical protein
MKLKTVFIFLFVLSAVSAFAQKTHHTGKNGNFDPGSTNGNPGKKDPRPDSIIHCFSLSLSYAYQIPGGDLLWRFGPNSNAGASAFYKTDKNYIYGFQWSYIFGNKLKGENPLDSISTSDGHVIDKEGKYADIRIFERGFTLGLSGGKIFNQFLSPNKNSGFFVMGGVGYLQHKFRIYDNGARSPLLTKTYLKGYDRLTSGFMTTEFLGYWYMSRNRYVTFFGGFEFMQGFTQSRRSWDYNLMRADTEKRIDLLSGVRFGWVIPLYKRNTATKYYY